MNVFVLFTVQKHPLHLLLLDLGVYKCMLQTQSLSPKKSWFSVFFSKSEKETEKEVILRQCLSNDKSPYSRNNLNLSFACSKPANDIVDDLQRILKAQNISFESLNSQTLAAEAESNSMMNPGTIKFNIEILSAGKDNNFLVSFEHVSGDPNE